MRARAIEVAESKLGITMVRHPVNMNGIFVKPPVQYEQVLRAHAYFQMGVILMPDQCSTFVPCEYDMKSIQDPLNTPFGKVHIKRTAMDAVVLLTREQMSELNPQGKLKGYSEVTLEEFERVVASGKVSFPYQVEHVRRALELKVHERGIPDEDGWTYSYERKAMAAFMEGNLIEFAAITGPHLGRSEAFKSKLADVVHEEGPSRS